MEPSERLTSDVLEPAAAAEPPARPLCAGERVALRQALEYLARRRGLPLPPPADDAEDA